MPPAASPWRDSSDLACRESSSIRDTVDTIPERSARASTKPTLVLDVALRLEKLLADEPGLEVTLTRRTNVYIPLEERTAIANRLNADLFISIHANASRNSAATGIETYFLSFASSPEAEAVAARENSASEREMHHLPDIIRAIALNNKLDESRDLAGMVQESLATRLRRTNRNLRNLGVKKAPFVVLDRRRDAERAGGDLVRDQPAGTATAQDGGVQGPHRRIARSGSAPLPPLAQGANVVATGGGRP